MIRLLRSAWERASIYLPVLLMGLLALGTYWLVHTAPTPRLVQDMARLRHEPDYFMRGFSLTVYDAQGRIKSEVDGAAMRHYPDNDSVEIDRPQIRAFKPGGQRTTASAELARAKGDGSEVEFIGDAVLAREPIPGKADATPLRLEFRSAYLQADMDAERVKSHRPVILSRGTERFAGDAFEYSALEQVLELRGHVVVDLAAKPRK
jgi:lipopolysaccharide export system protein LptC